VGPGSSAGDYAAAGVPFEQRWRRFDEAVQALRALLRGEEAGFSGEFYSTRGVVLEPRPVRAQGPPVWVASWGSPAGLRRIFVWPLRDEAAQLALFRERVTPLVPRQP
jgi:alkanesulfonate monooxygenase SsuD/methylene tetrahydromethanopterin reductase-like flavin-dependent oxidoreductase (luciferase family)